MNAAARQRADRNADARSPHSPVFTARQMASATTTPPATYAVERGVIGASSQVYARTIATIATVNTVFYVSSDIGRFKWKPAASWYAFASASSSISPNGRA